MAVAFLFSGQGSQYVGMGKELSENFPTVQKIYRCCEDILSIDIKKLTFEGSDDDLTKTEISQPAIFTASLVCLEAARESGIENTAVCGHSLGEYAAMVAAGVISMEDGFRLIKARSEIMGKVGKQTPGAMYAIIGTDADVITDICGKTEGYVTPVNFNSPAQTVIAGDINAAVKAAETIAGMGGKAIKLAVSAAFHSKHMQKASDMFLPHVREITYNNPTVNIYSNLYGNKLTDFTGMPEYLAKHISSPVLFTAELIAMANDGIDTFIELGPKKTLAGFAAKTVKTAKCLNIEDMKTLERTTKNI